MTEQSDSTPRFQAMWQQAMESMSGPIKELIQEEIEPLKLRIDELEIQVAELSRKKSDDAKTL
jgi:hypothetical protein